MSRAPHEPKDPFQDEMEDTLSRAHELTDQRIENIRNRVEKVQATSRRGSRSDLTDLIQRQHALLERMKAQPGFVGEVVQVVSSSDGAAGYTIVTCNGRALVVESTPELSLAVGDTVKLSAETSQIVSVLQRISAGSLCVVRRIIGESTCEVDFNGVTRIVLVGVHRGKIEIGDRVILDSSGSIVVQHAGRSERQFKAPSLKPIAWDDIIGLDSAKAYFRESIELAFTDRATEEHYKSPRPKGILILGPPGCGKTMLGEAAATALARTHGDQALESGYFYIRGPEVLDMYVGNSEKAIFALFEQGERHFKTHGYPAIIFIDECEALLSRRGSGKSADMEKTIVPTFLACMNTSHSLVILATNRADVLDPAVIRDGRIDRHVSVTRPTQENAVKILELSLKKYPLATGAENVHEYAAHAARLVYDSRRTLFDQVISLKDGTQATFTLGHIVTGAMLADGVVKRAVSLAKARDRAAGQLTGISAADIEQAVLQLYHEKKSLNYHDELKDFFRSIQDAIAEPEMRQIQKP